jgi:hypothetical protein
MASPNMLFSGGERQNTDLKGATVIDKITIDRPDQPFLVPLIELLHVLFILATRTVIIATETALGRMLPVIGAWEHRIHVVFFWHKACKVLLGKIPGLHCERRRPIMLRHRATKPLLEEPGQESHRASASTDQVEKRMTKRQQGETSMASSPFGKELTTGAQGISPSRNGSKSSPASLV